MISEVVMPQMGADMTEGTVLRWLKHEGETVNRGEIIAEIETDKANVEIEAFEGGTFRKALAGEGDTVKVGEVIAVVADPNEDISKYAANGVQSAAIQQPAQSQQPVPAERREPLASSDEPGQTAPKQQAPQAVPREPEPSSPATEPARVDQTAAASADGAPEAGATPTGEEPPTPAPPAHVRPPQPAAASRAARQEAPSRQADDEPTPLTNGRVRASPLARRIADERGVDLRRVRGSGPGGRILRHDVEEAPAPGAKPSEATVPIATPVAPSPPAPLVAGVVQMSRMRQAIARRMSQSKREAPHYYLLVDIDMTDAMAFRKQVNDTQTDDARVSVNDLIVRACALALQRHPMFNATIAGEQVTTHDQQNVCIGIALDDGLIAPAILDAGRKSLVQIAREAKDLIVRAKGGSLRADEISAGTFTITNLGAYGIETLIGIIQPPQTAILGVGSVMDQPVARDGAVTVRQVMKVALSADHRVTDGAQGAQFLTEIKRLLEKPLLLVL